MTTVAVHAVDPARFDQVLALLARSDLPEDGLIDHVATTLVAEEDGHIVGSAALELYGQAALLRSVAVDSRRRNQGIGQRLVGDILALATGRQVRWVYLLTESAVPYFVRLGFRTVDRADVAPAVKASVEFLTACPQSAHVMMKDIG